MMKEQHADQLIHDRPSNDLQEFESTHAFIHYVFFPLTSHICDWKFSRYDVYSHPDDGKVYLLKNKTVPYGVLMMPDTIFN